MNPLKSFMGQGGNMNPLNMFLQMRSGGVAPQAIFNQMLQSIPGAQQFISQMQNQANGRTPQQLAEQCAKQAGLGTAEYNQLLKTLGLR